MSEPILQQQIALSNISKGAAWSPDGNRILSIQEDAKTRIYQLDETEHLEEKLVVEEKESIYDFRWFPGMSDDAATQCFITCVRENPMYLRDANDGRVRASYRGYNQQDEMSNCYSVAFCPITGNIVGGYKSELWLFDMNRPGRQTQTIITSVRKGKGPKGIIGAVEPHPTWGIRIIALGTYHKHLAIYQDWVKKPLMLVDREEQMGGVTFLKWQSEDILISGHRQDQYLRIWDTRYPSEPLERIVRPIKTPQRSRFSYHGNNLCFGKDNGVATIINNNEPVSWKAHQSVVLTADINPVKSHLILTTAGTRMYPNYGIDIDLLPEEESIPYINDDLSLKIWKKKLS